MAIVGYMGSGKSTVGRALARALRREFVDLDHAIARRVGCEIPEIFAENGEDHFRDLEHQTLLDALERHPRSVLACGGGVVVRPDNRALLREAATVFLREDTQILYNRTRGAGRPLRAASPEDFERRSYDHPENGPTTLRAALGIYAWHGRHHVAHVTRLRERMGW